VLEVQINSVPVSYTEKSVQLLTKTPVIALFPKSLSVGTVLVYFRTMVVRLPNSVALTLPFLSGRKSIIRSVIS
jgi:hypothetical protein